MRAIVLVGGEGTRLRPLTYTTPKQMLPVVEVALIERVVGQLAAHGVTEVILSLGYRPDAFLAAFPEGRCAGARLSYAVEPELLDTAGAVRFAAGEAGIAETFLVFNGDVLTDLDIAGLVDFHRQRGGQGTISLTPVDDPSSFGVVACDPDGRVEAFIEKPAPGTAPTNLINAGIYVLEPSVLDRIDPGRRVNIEREVFPRMVDDGCLFALAGAGYWLDVGTRERYLQACADLLSGVRPGRPTDAAVDTGAHVWRRGQAEIAGSVVGPAWVGDRATIGVGAVVERSVVESGAVVGEGAKVVGSVVLAGASIGARSEVDGSIIGGQARVGDDVAMTTSLVGFHATVPAGARLANERVPE